MSPVSDLRLGWLSLLLSLPLTSVSCAGLEFGQVQWNQEIDAEALAELHPKHSDLGDCLAALGAPTEVTADENGQDFVLTWLWLQQSDWGFFFSFPLSDVFNASVNYGGLHRRPHRLRLIFSPLGELREIASD